MESKMSQREVNNAKLSQKVAEQGMVLLQNKNNVLPLQNHKVALFGSGAFEVVKCGTGSSDVNQRHVISIIDGLEDAGFQIVSKGWLTRYQRAYEKNKRDYYDKNKDSLLAILAPAFSMDDPEIGEFPEAKTGIYVVSRSAGEGQDRKNEPGDFLLTENELANIQAMSQFYENSVVLLNVGGVIDTSFVEDCPLLDSVLLISQPGMQAGRAVANVLDGSKTPSGKLTDTWAKQYEDYYTANSFGQKEPHYQEGIYVGYRYFDSFGIEPRYEFGFGLSYTDFFIQTKHVHVNEQTIDIDVSVQNTGETYRGAEVVQLYVSNPQSNIPTPYQSLVGFVKTKPLYPEQEQTVKLSVPVKNLAVFDESTAAFTLVAGTYIIRIGNSSKNTEVIAEFRLDEDVIVSQLEHKLLPETDPTILRSNNVKIKQTKQVPFFLLNAENFAGPEVANYHDENEVTTFLDRSRSLPGKGLNETIQRLETANAPKLVDVYHQKISLEQFVASMSDQELIDLVEGVLTPEQTVSIVGNGAQSVPGAAGETVENLNFGISKTVNADGPAGLRLTQKYQDESGETQYQYATAWPIGTMLAQTWDTDLIKLLGSAVGKEMKEFGITMWLAPGMNIHRDPLGGRNFEYFSEDPVLSGTISAAEVNGVQENPGVGATIKHFLANNQETKRNTGNSVVGEQALREIYLKNFEITVRSAQPMAVMSSYNQVNGTFAGANFESLTNVLRDEWHFQGLVMTDWYSLADPVASMHAGNDLIMPGASQDKLLAAIADLGPEFDKFGIIKKRQIFDVATFSSDEIELWNDFIPDPEGVEVVKIDLTDADSIDESLLDMIYAGTAQILDQHTLLISGRFKDNNSLYIGDLQKSAMNILKVIMKSDRFMKMIDEASVPYNHGSHLVDYFTAE